MAQFRMPSLGSDMEEGTLVEWLVKPGDTVKHGDIVAVIETQKGAIEIEIFEDATIRSLLVEPGVTVPVGTPLAEIETAAAPVAEAAPPAPTQEPAPEPEPAIAPSPAPQPAAPPAAPPAGPSGRVRATPAARRLAAERGVALESLKGSGIGGAVQSADVPAAAGGAEKPARAGLDMDEMRKAIAASMSRSKREIPHYYLSHSFDIGTAKAWLDDENARREPAERLLLGALYLKACASALRKYPMFNGFYEADGFRPSAQINIGMAINIRGGGLVAPAIHDTDALDLDTIMAKMRDLTARVRVGRIRGSELTGPTVTLSSLGDRGVEALFGVIFPPQVALLGFGRVEEKPWRVDGAIGLRPILTVTLSGDHRANDGHAGGLLLLEIERFLNQPEAL